jgi:hypothetical protein
MPNPPSPPPPQPPRPPGPATPRPPAGPKPAGDLSQVRATAGRIGGLTRWAKELDPTAATAPARAAFLRRFDAQVPAEITDPDERTRRAEKLMRAHMIRLSDRAARARREKAA